MSRYRSTRPDPRSRLTAPFLRRIAEIEERREAGCFPFTLPFMRIRQRRGESMSFDLGVWYSDAPMTLEQARSYYARINEDWVDLRRWPEFDEFLRLLLDRFPDPSGRAAAAIDPDEPPGALLMSIGELKTLAKNSPPAPQFTPEQMEDMRKKAENAAATMKKTPWAGSMTPTGSGIALGIGWGDVETVAPVVVSLAARTHLLVYDPQNSRVCVPPALAGRDAAAIPSPRVTLTVAGNSPDVHAIVALDDRVLLDVTVPSRREAHRQARALTLEHGLDYYAAKDPRSLAQSMTLTPISPDDPLHAVPLPPGAEAFELKLRDEDG
jgi:hypothetical protein